MLAAWILFAALAALFFLAIWIVLPAPNMGLLLLGIGAPELSPLLLGASLLLGGFTWLTRPGPVRTLAACLAVVTSVLCAVPLARLALAVPRLDAAMSGISGAADAARSRMRSRRFVARELWRGIETGESQSVRGVEFAKPEGEPLALTVYRPSVSGRFPILVQLYGGAWQRGAPDDNAAFAQYFASRGHVVFAIDYRHAPRWQWPAQIEDVRAALAWIRAHGTEYDGDVTRMALVGRSAGAQLALVAAYEARADDVKGVVSFYGPVDLVEGWRVPPRPDPLGVREVLEVYLGGTPDQRLDRYRDASPISHVSSSAPPTLLIYATRDHVVEARFGRQLHERLQAAGATSVLLELPWAAHAFDALQGGLGGQASLYYTERFLAAVLR